MALDAPPHLTFDRATWSPEVRDRLARIDGAAPMLATWQAMVASGAACLMVLRDADGADRGVMIWRAERDGDRLGLIVPAMSCEPLPGVDLVALTAQLCRVVAAEIGADFLRFWTQRRGLAVRAEALGFEVSYVCEAGL